MEEKIKIWYFMFGMGHPHAGKFTRITGTWEGARQEMIRRYGRKWSHQYDAEKWFDEKTGLAQSDIYDLKEIV